MSLTLDELCDKIKSNYEEVLVCELLDISSEDLVDRFVDRIEERFDKLAEDFEYDESE